MKSALEGSPDAAGDLATYYVMYDGDESKGIYWSQIAAENGGESNAFNYAGILYSDKSNNMNIMRARFWAKRAAEKGDRDAQSLLESIEKDLAAQKHSEKILQAQRGRSKFGIPRTYILTSHHKD